MKSLKLKSLEFDVVCCTFISGCERRIVCWNVWKSTFYRVSIKGYG